MSGVPIVVLGLAVLPLATYAEVTGDMDGNGKDDVIVDAGPGFGLWVRINDSTWVQLHNVSPESVVTGGKSSTG